MRLPPCRESYSGRRGAVSLYVPSIANLIFMHTITKQFEFQAAHVLSWHPGKCSRIHGHGYVLEVSVTGHLNDSGVVVDPSVLHEFVKNEIVDKYDHHLLNDFFGNPTAEVLAEKFFMTLQEKWSVRNCWVTQVRLSETRDTWVAFPVTPYEVESE